MPQNINMRALRYNTAGPFQICFLWAWLVTNRSREDAPNGDRYSEAILTSVFSVFSVFESLFKMVTSARTGISYVALFPGFPHVQQLMES